MENYFQLGLFWFEDHRHLLLDIFVSLLFASSLRPNISLPPAYVVRREDNSFTLLVCPLGGGGKGGVRSGEPTGGGGQVSQPMGGVSQPTGGGGGSGQSADRGGGGQVSQLTGGGGQHLAPSCGRYASCVHAGGLFCLL